MNCHNINKRATTINKCEMNCRRVIAPARSVGASYSESGVSNDLVSIHPVSDVRPEKTSKTPNGICIGHGARYHSGYFSVDFQGAEEKCVCAVKE